MRPQSLVKNQTQRREDVHNTEVQQIPLLIFRNVRYGNTATEIRGHLTIMKGVRQRR